MDNAAFEKIIRSVKDVALRLAVSMLSDRDEAEDVVQDVLERLWRNRNALGNYDNPAAFVYTSTRNCCIDRIRSRKIRREKANSIAFENQSECEMGKSIEMRDINRAIGEIIAALPEKQQIAIHLRDVEGMEFAEIAQITGMDEANIRVALSRARKTVREELTQIMNHGV